MNKIYYARGIETIYLEDIKRFIILKETYDEEKYGIIVFKSNCRHKYDYIVSKEDFKNIKEKYENLGSDSYAK
jgi:hypothetical protein